MGRAFSTLYLAGDPAAQAIFAPAFRDPALRQRRVQHAARHNVPAALLEALREQQAALPASAARQENLDALAQGNVAVVATGQQVGLFLGPLYTFYKAASAIAVARALEAESKVRCVPLFWLQTEDHDFAEIRFSRVAGRDGEPVRLELASGSPSDTRVSVAHRLLEPETSAVLDHLSTLLQGEPGADEVLALLRDQYQPGQPLAKAFAGVLSTLFAEEGLLFLDPRDARVAALAAPTYRACLEHADAIEGRLKDRLSALIAADIAVQVPVRPRSALVFFHQGNAAGPRYRLQREQGAPQRTQWSLAGTTETIAHADLLDLLEQDPLRFSTSALLRPIVQDTLLPIAAYVGGPGEINYFAELLPLYEHFGLLPPLLVPRARFRYVDARSRRWLEQTGLRASDFSGPVEELRTRLQPGRPAGAPDPQELRHRIDHEILPAVEQIALAIATTEEHLRRTAERTRDSVAHALEQLLGRYQRVLVEQDETTQRRLHQLGLALAPEGVAQERFYGWPWLAGRLGVAPLKRLVFEQLERSGVFSKETLELLP